MQPHVRLGGGGVRCGFDRRLRVGEASLPGAHLVSTLLHALESIVARLVARRRLHHAAALVDELNHRVGTKAGGALVGGDLAFDLAELLLLYARPSNAVTIVDLSETDAYETRFTAELGQCDEVAK